MLYAIASLLLLVGQVQAYGRYEMTWWSGEVLTIRPQLIGGVRTPAYAVEIAHRIDANGNCAASGDYTVDTTIHWKTDWCSTDDYNENANHGKYYKDCMNTDNGAITRSLMDGRYNGSDNRKKFRCAIRLRLLYKTTDEVVTEYWDSDPEWGNNDDARTPAYSSSSAFCASPPANLAAQASGVDCWKWNDLEGVYTGEGSDGTAYRLAAPCASSGGASSHSPGNPEPMEALRFIPLGKTVATNKLIVPTNGVPPVGYRAKDNGYPCLCKGAGTHRLSCGQWCGPGSPHGAGTDPWVLSDEADDSYAVQFWNGDPAGLHWEVDPDYDGYNPWA